MKKCDKDGYTKGHAETLKKNLYTHSKRNMKLRIYFCGDCHLYHLTSSINGSKQED